MHGLDWDLAEWIWEHFWGRRAHESPDEPFPGRTCQRFRQRLWNGAGLSSHRHGALFTHRFLLGLMTFHHMNKSRCTACSCRIRSSVSIPFTHVAFSACSPNLNFTKWFRCLLWAEVPKNIYDELHQFLFIFEKNGISMTRCGAYEIERRSQEQQYSLNGQTSLTFLKGYHGKQEKSSNKR